MVSMSPRWASVKLWAKAFGGGLALVQFGHRLFEYFRMRDEIVLHDGLDLAALTVGEGLRRGGRCAERQREQSGREQAERGHMQFLLNRISLVVRVWTWFGS